MSNFLESGIVDIILGIKDTYGSQVFLNSTLVHNLLCDLAVNYPKERIQIRNLLELGGFSELNAAGDDYKLVRKKLIKRYADTYFVEERVAVWAVDVLGVVLGMIERENIGAPEVLGRYVPPPKPPRINAHRHLENTAAEWVYTVALKHGYFYIIGRKKDGTILKSRVDPSMLMRLSRLKVLLLHQKRVVQIYASYLEAI